MEICPAFQFFNGQNSRRNREKYLTLTELVNEFNTQVSILKKHIFFKRCQSNYHNSLKNNLKCEQLLIKVDYSENYVNQKQQEIQSAYSGHAFRLLQLAVTFVPLTESS